MMEHSKQIIRIAKTQGIKEFIETLPSELNDERQKLIELIKKTDGKELIEVGYVVFTWDPELSYGETRLFSKDFQELEL